MRAHRGMRNGFTLIEVLLVIVILGMLAGVGIVALWNTGEGAKVDTTKLKIDEVVKGLDLYKMHIGRYPSEEDGGLAALRTKPAFSEETLAEKWRGPYLTEDAVDPWGNALNYEVVESGSAETVSVPVKVWSNGPDGTSGTDDDIKNWKEES